MRSQERNTYFLFKVFYAPSTKYEFNFVVVQLVLSKYICSIFHEPPTFAINRKQVLKVNGWKKTNGFPHHSNLSEKWNWSKCCYLQNKLYLNLTNKPMEIIRNYRFSKFYIPWTDIGWYRVMNTIKHYIIENCSNNDYKTSLLNLTRPVNSRFIQKTGISDK